MSRCHCELCLSDSVTVSVCACFFLCTTHVCLCVCLSQVTLVRSCERTWGVLSGRPSHGLSDSRRVRDTQTFHRKLGQTDREFKTFDLGHLALSEASPNDESETVSLLCLALRLALSLSLFLSWRFLCYLSISTTLSPRL